MALAAAVVDVAEPLGLPATVEEAADGVGVADAR